MTTEIITDTSALGQMERAQIDMQIATARRYPRSLSKVKSNMLSFATLDEETAAGCFYTLPGRRGGDGKPLQGPSVRLAEIALSQYQHIRAGSRIIEDDGKFITAQGVVHDLENNVVISIEVKRRVTTKEGKRYSDDMIATTGNAACSIALRNAAFRVIPLALVKPVYEAAKSLAIGDGKSLVQRRASSIDHFAKLGISKEQVCATLGIRAVEDINLEHLELLIGYATAIKDGDVTVDEVFKTPEPKHELPKENPFKEAVTPEEPPTVDEPKDPNKHTGKVTITDIGMKEGEDNGKKWVLYMVSMHTPKAKLIASTFSKSIYEFAESRVGQSVIAEIEKTDKGWQIKSILDEEGS